MVRAQTCPLGLGFYSISEFLPFSDGYLSELGGVTGYSVISSFQCQLSSYRDKMSLWLLFMGGGHTGPRQDRSQIKENMFYLVIL